MKAITLAVLVAMNMTSAQAAGDLNMYVDKEGTTHIVGFNGEDNKFFGKTIEQMPGRDFGVILIETPSGKGVIGVEKAACKKGKGAYLLNDLKTGNVHPLKWDKKQFTVPVAAISMICSDLFHITLK